MARMEKHTHTLFSLSLFLTTVWMNDDGDDIILPTLSCASVRFSSDYSNHLCLSFSPRVRIKRVVANFHLRPAVSSSVRWQIFVCRSWRPLWRFIVLLCRRCKCSQRTYIRSAVLLRICSVNIFRARSRKEPSRCLLCSLLNFSHYFCPFKSTQLNSTRSTEQRRSCSFWSNSINLIGLFHYCLICPCLSAENKVCGASFAVFYGFFRHISTVRWSC